MSESVQNASLKFSDASNYLSSASSLSKVSNTVKLELYGLFKYVTVSPTPNINRPSIFDMTGRAKWDAWKTVGTTYSQKEDAEIRYIEIAKTLGWTEDSQVVHDSKSERPAEENMWDEGATRSDSGGAGGLGVAVSAMARPAEVKEETVHGAAISNDTSGLSILLENHAEIDLNSLDEFGYTPLHLAADRGHLPIIRILVDRGANLTIKDSDGFTASELASIAGHHEIRELLSL